MFDSDSKLYIMEFYGTGKSTEIDIHRLISKEIIDAIKSQFVALGISISFIGLDNTEKFTEIFFKNQGYTVIGCPPAEINSELFKLVSAHKLPEQILKASKESGVPDYFCFKNKKDWFFAEAKSENDGLRLSQVRWLIENKIRTKVIYVEKVETKTKYKFNPKEKNNSIKTY